MPCATGEILIRRENGDQAQIIEHYLGGSQTPRSVTISAGQLRLASAERNSKGAPLEWIEVKIT